MQVKPDLVSAGELRRQLTRVLPDWNQSLGIPPSCYADNSLLRLEQQAVFHQGWVALGRVDRWLEPGDFSALNIAGVPLIVICNKVGDLRAFANSCRHRGSQLLNGNGNCKKIKCPFHWWTYDLDGRLKVYSRMENALDFDADDYALVEFPVEVRQGFVFTSFSDAAPAIDNWLSQFEHFHQSWSLENWCSTRVREFEVKSNWKTFLEVFNEYYHLPMVHPESINWLYPEPDAADEVDGQFTTQFGATEAAAALMQEAQQHALPTAPGLQGDEARGTRYTLIYPNLSFALSQDSMWIYQALPLSADRCQIIQTVCFPEASLRLDDFSDRAEHYYQRIDAALDEDLPFLEQQQRGLNSKFARQGRFAALEPSVGKFAYWYAQQLLRQLDSTDDFMSHKD